MSVTGTSASYGIGGARVGLLHAPAGTVVLAGARRVYDSRTSSPLAAGQTVTIPLASVASLPVDAVGAVCALSVLNPYGSGTLTVGPAGSSARGVGIERARTGDRLTNRVTTQMSAQRSIAVTSTADSGTTDQVVDVVGYLV